MFLFFFFLQDQLRSIEISEDDDVDSSFQVQIWNTSPVWILLLGKNVIISYFRVLPFNAKVHSQHYSLQYW